VRKYRKLANEREEKMKITINGGSEEKLAKENGVKAKKDSERRIYSKRERKEKENLESITGCRHRLFQKTAQR